MQLSIRTSIIINDTVENVWKIFSDFDQYKNWNPFIKKIEGDISKGNTISIELSGMKFKPEVLVYEPEKELTWKGKLLFKGLFDGEHSFKFIDNADGTTTFNHSENFNGLLVRFFKNKLLKDTKTGFESMNESLKKEVERNV